MSIGVFLEHDVSREEREKRRVIIQEREAEWELRGKTDQRGKMEKREVNRKIGVEQCKEDSYERETDEIGRVDEEK